jgi:hypothetical protein
MEREVDNQVAAPAETRTPNLHRVTTSLTKSADGRVATVALGRGNNLVQRKNKRTDLTPTGLLMEGDFTFSPLSLRYHDFSPTGSGCHKTQF